MTICSEQNLVKGGPGPRQRNEREVVLVAVTSRRMSKRTVKHGRSLLIYI